MSQVPSNIVLRDLASNLAFPEGPTPLRDGSCLVVEIDGGRLSRVFPDGSVTTVADTGGGPNRSAVGPDGQIYICNNGGYERDEGDDPYADRQEGDPMPLIPIASERAPSGKIQR